MTTRTIERPKVEKLTAPAKRWRNRYRVLESYLGQSISTGALVTRRAGEEFWAPRTWPSKEIAEQKAHELVLMRSALSRGKTEYLGAFPVEAS